MIICKRCLEAYRSHGERIYARPIGYDDLLNIEYSDEDEELVRCEFCEDEVPDSEANIIEEE